MSLRQQLLEFIEGNLVHEGRGRLSEDDSLIERGLVDSIGLLQIMLFVEEQTGLSIPDREVTPENFQTVAHIDRLVRRLRGEQPD